MSPAKGNDYGLPLPEDAEATLLNNLKDDLPSIRNFAIEGGLHLLKWNARSPEEDRSKRTFRDCNDLVLSMRP